MKNLLTNDVMLTTTRVWLKITSPQKRAVSYKMTARTQAHSVRNMHIIKVTHEIGKKNWYLLRSIAACWVKKSKLSFTNQNIDRYSPNSP